MATHPVRCQVTAQPFGSFGEEGDVLGRSLHPGEASFGLLTTALGEPGTGVSPLPLLLSRGAVTLARAASLGHCEV